MLIEKQWRVDDICTVKMGSGEEIITKIVAADDTSITVSKPLSVQLGQDPQTNRVGLTLVPGFALTTGVDTKLKINLSQVTFIAPTDDSIKKSYLSSTTGLAIAGAGAASSLKL